MIDSVGRLYSKEEVLALIKELVDYNSDGYMLATDENWEGWEKRGEQILRKAEEELDG